MISLVTDMTIFTLSFDLNDSTSALLYIIKKIIFIYIFKFMMNWLVYKSKIWNEVKET